MNQPESPRLASLLLPLAGLALFLKMAAFNSLLGPNTVQWLWAGAGMAAIAVLAVAWVAFLPSRWRWGALLAAHATGSLLVLADLWYWRHFGEVFPMGALSYGSQAIGVSSSVWAIAKPEDLLFVADWLVLAALTPFAARPLAWAPRLPRRAIAALMAGALGTIATSLGAFERIHPHAMEGGWNPRYIASTIGVGPYHLVDAYYTSRARQADSLDDDTLDRLAGWVAEQNRRRAPAAMPLAAGKNLIAIQVEALQAFAVGLEIEGRPVTPHLNRLAAQGLFAPNVYAQTRDGNTSDSEFMVNTGLYAAPRGAAFVRFAGNAYDALPAALRDRGYATVAMHANTPGFWNRYTMYRTLGFDRFESAEDYAQTDYVELGLSDEAFFAQSAEKIAALPRPFFAWMVTMSSHHPFEGAARLSDLDTGALEGTRLGNYLKSIHYADAQVGAFVADLERRGLWDQSVVVLFGDHTGVQPEDRDALFALTGTDPASPHAWRSLQKVPLIIHAPGLAPQRIELAAGQLDILPTVAGLYGLSFPLAFGQDLRTATSGFVVFGDGSFIAGDRFGEAGSPEALVARDHQAHSATILQHDLALRLQERLIRLAKLP